MSIGERLIDTYKKVLVNFEAPTVTPRVDNYEKPPRILYKTNNHSYTLFPNLIEACAELYNQIDSAVETLKLTVPEVYKESAIFITGKIIGGLTSHCSLYSFKGVTPYSFYGSIQAPDMDLMPFGIRSVIDLLSKAMECGVGGLRTDSDAYYYTAWVSYRSLEGALKQFSTRFNYVMLYPHRIVLDRVVLETALRKEGMEKVISFVQSAEEHFNEGKYVEFCAMSRNALQETIKNLCLVLDGAEHGFSENLKRLNEICYIKSTIVKQAKEFGGSLSACGSHPPEETLSDEEAKFLLDSLYGFLGVFLLRLSSFKKKKGN